MTVLANPSATGWRVYATEGGSQVLFALMGGKPIKARVVKGRLTRLDVLALKALQQPVLAGLVPRGSRVTAPQRWRGRDNTGANRRAFILRLGGRPAVEILLTDQSLVGTGLHKALQYRINHRQTGPVPAPPQFVRNQENGKVRPAGEHRTEAVLADPEEPGPGPVEGLDQSGLVHSPGAQHQEQVGAC